MSRGLVSPMPFAGDGCLPLQSRVDVGLTAYILQCSAPRRILHGD